MPYVEVWVDGQDVEDVVRVCSDNDWEDFVRTYRKEIMKALAADAAVDVESALSNPVERLGVITALRNQGYTVEPA